MGRERDSTDTRSRLDAIGEELAAARAECRAAQAYLMWLETIKQIDRRHDCHLRPLAANDGG